MCMCVRERVHVCVCERESACVCVCERECMCVCVYVCERVRVCFVSLCYLVKHTHALSLSMGYCYNKSHKLKGTK